MSNFIGIDWGSTNFRAYLIDQDGCILDKKSAACGMLTLQQPSAFAAALKQHVGDWLTQHPHITIIMSGMVGARQGWVEAAYLSCPVSLEHLAERLTVVDFDNNHPCYIVPGLSLLTADDFDVMRGEETQLYGAIKDEQQRDVFCLPGTHSKWVLVKGYQVEAFRTYMTGELFALLEKHSILSKQISEHINEDAFFEGIKQAKNYHGLLSDLFKIRAATLLERRAKESTYSYLSGLLIGYEIMESRDYWLADEERPIFIVASESIANWYQKAFDYFGCSRATLVDPEAAIVAGLTKVYNKFRS